MQLTRNQHNSFQGTYYLTSDNHSRPVASVGLFQKIENSAKSDVSAIHINNGDFYSGFNDLMSDIYTTFADRNKNIQQIFNFGNCEFFMLRDMRDTLKKEFAKLSSSGIKIIFSPIDEICKKLNIDRKELSHVKPYALATDIVDGKERKVLIVGSSDTRNPDILSLEEQGDILAKTIKEATKKHKPDEIVLASHNTIENTKTILDNLKSKGISNIKLVAGGHSHKIEDEFHNNSHIFHPAPEGRAAFKILSDKNGYHINKVKYDPKNRYDYSILEKQNNDQIIHNIDTNLNELDESYKKLIQKTNLLEEISDTNIIIRNRVPGFPISYPSELGTMIANKMRDITNSNFSIVLSQDNRGELPPIGTKIRLYHVADVANVDKKVWILNVTPKEIYDIFNIALSKQHDSVANSDFFEYSDNIKIERYTNIEDEAIGNFKSKAGKIGQTNKNRIKEIYIKENNKWIPLSEIPADKKFSVSTCSFIANGERASLSYFKNIKDKKELSPNLKTRNVFIAALKEAQEKQTPIKTSIIKDFIKN